LPWTEAPFPKEVDMKALACTLVVIVAMVWPSAAAVALDITFDDVISVGNPLVTMLDAHGYRFTGSFRTIDAPGAALASNGSAVYLGQEASGPGIIVTRSDGGPFILYEFAAAGLHVLPSPGLPDAQQVKVVGRGPPEHDLRVEHPSQLRRLLGSQHLDRSPDGDLHRAPVHGHARRACSGRCRGPGTLALAVITALGACAVALRRHRSHSFRHR
jgi:hypothetical protein